MNFRNKLSGLKRTDFDNKTDRQARQILQKHIDATGSNIDLDKEVLTSRNINRIKKQLTKDYNKLAREENRLFKKYEKVKDKLKDGGIENNTRCP